MKKNFKVLMLIVVAICVGTGASVLWLCWQHVSQPKLTSLNEFDSILSANSQSVFEPVLPDSPVILPEDFRFHQDFQQEWWHFFANVTDERGREYGIQWSYLRVAREEAAQRGWLNPQLFISYISIGSRENSVHEQRIARGGVGQAGMENRPFRIWLDNWNWRSLGKTPFPGQLRASSDKFAIDMLVNPVGPFVLPGEQGYVVKDDMLPIASYNFSAPFLNVNGKMMLDDGEQVTVRGHGWLSKEWGTGLLASQHQGWDWLVIPLDETSTLSVHRYRRESRQPYLSGYIATNDGKYWALDDSQLTLEPLLHSTLENGHSVPLEWELRVPRFGVNVRVRPINTNQWLPFVVPYWQGAIETIGSHNSQGFMQLYGY